VPRVFVVVEPLWLLEWEHWVGVASCWRCPLQRGLSFAWLESPCADRGRCRTHGRPRMASISFC